MSVTLCLRKEDAQCQMLGTYPVLVSSDQASRVCSFHPSPVLGDQSTGTAQDEPVAMT